MSEYVQQLNLFGAINPEFRLKGKVKLIELFAGIGSQYLALKILEQAQKTKEFEVESHKICEWAYNSYIMYNLMHIKDDTDYSKDKTKEEMLERIKGTSTDYNKPLTMDQLKKKPIEWVRKAYNSCIATHNLVDISNVKGKDLDFDDNVNETIVMSYSFPCQDISLSGKQSGCKKGSGTRSGLLWEVERILEERERERLPLPNVLIMENVSALLSQKFINDFKDWETKLASLGYTNHVKVLDTCKHGGIPQHRQRVFMISILGDYAYNFPAKMPLKHCLEDMLEKNVSEKYYLDDETINRISQWKSQQQPLDNAIDIERERERVSPTLTARGAGEEHSGMILIKGNFPNSIPIKNATKKGYLTGEKGDGIDISGRMEYHRGTVQKGKSQTLTCQGGENIGVIIDE